jgi:50S ribosomal subunit-associated GTPase HflX
MAKLTVALAQLREERKRAQRQVETLEEAISVIGRLVGKNGSRGMAGKMVARRRLSAAARKRISLAQKARWAKVRSQLKKAA